jgi:hypothetical protein
MATQAQTAANRRNARKSTGPKSRAGKQRASNNSYRYGLSLGTVSWEGEAVESLARRIAGSNASDAALGHASAAARAQLHLARIRAIKTEIINRTFHFGALKLRPRFHSTAAEIRFLKLQPFDRPVKWPLSLDPLGPMPSDQAERMDAALTRSLPEVRKLYRYERRAIAERDRALRKLSELISRGGWSSAAGDFAKRTH